MSNKHYSLKRNESHHDGRQTNPSEIEMLLILKDKERYVECTEKY